MMKRCLSDLYRFIIGNVMFQFKFLIRNTNYKDRKRPWKIHMNRLNSRPIRCSKQICLIEMFIKTKLNFIIGKIVKSYIKYIIF